MRRGFLRFKTFVMRSSYKLITVKGISVYLHFTFLFVVLWIAVLYIASGMYWTHLAWSLLLLAAVFASVTLHEYGHALVASFFGINAKKIVLYPIGGIASLEKLPEAPRQELWVSSAGPAVSLVIGGVLLLFAPQPFSLNSFNEYTGVINSSNFVYTLGLINVVLAVFNLIPALPMDGGRILRALLAFKHNYIKATSITASIGRVVAIAFVIIGLVTLQFMLSVIGLFIILFAKSEESYLQYKSLVNGLQLKEILIYDYNSMEAELDVHEAADILENNHSRQFIVMSEGKPVGTIQRMEIIKAAAEQEYSKKVGALMQENLAHLQSDMKVAEVLDTLSVNEETLYPVYEKDAFIGVINFRAVVEYLLLHKTSKKEFYKAKTLASTH